MGCHKTNPMCKQIAAGCIRKVNRWEDLDGLVSVDGVYKIVIDLEGGNGWIVSNSNPDKRYQYLSTHTFYGKSYQTYNKILKKYRFCVELETWD